MAIKKKIKLAKTALPPPPFLGGLTVVAAEAGLTTKGVLDPPVEKGSGGSGGSGGSDVSPEVWGTGISGEGTIGSGIGGNSDGRDGSGLDRGGSAGPPRLSPRSEAGASASARPSRDGSGEAGVSVTYQGGSFTTVGLAGLSINYQL